MWGWDKRTKVELLFSRAGSKAYELSVCEGFYVEAQRGADAADVFSVQLLQNSSLSSIIQPAGWKVNQFSDQNFDAFLRLTERADASPSLSADSFE